MRIFYSIEEESRFCFVSIPALFLQEDPGAGAKRLSDAWLLAPLGSRLWEGPPGRTPHVPPCPPVSLPRWQPNPVCRKGAVVGRDQHGTGEHPITLGGTA